MLNTFDFALNRYNTQVLPTTTLSFFPYFKSYVVWVEWIIYFFQRCWLFLGPTVCCIFDKLLNVCSHTFSCLYSLYSLLLHLAHYIKAIHTNHVFLNQGSSRTDKLQILFDSNSSNVGCNRFFLRGHVQIFTFTWNSVIF